MGPYGLGLGFTDPQNYHAASILQDSRFDCRNFVVRNTATPSIRLKRVARLLPFCYHSDDSSLCISVSTSYHTLKGLTLTPSHCFPLPKSASPFPPLVCALPTSFLLTGRPRSLRHPRCLPAAQPTGSSFGPSQILFLHMCLICPLLLLSSLSAMKLPPTSLLSNFPNLMWARPWRPLPSDHNDLLMSLNPRLASSPT